MRVCRAVAALLILGRGAFAQVDSTDKTKPAPKFDVAVIKPAAPGAACDCLDPLPGGRVNFTNTTLKDLIQIAYGLRLSSQISGGPKWVGSVHYDIEAKPDKPETDWPVMLQALLADRFQLVLHRETRELPIYALVLARKNGKLGPGMVETKEGDCAPFDPSRPASRRKLCGLMFLDFDRGQLWGSGLPLSSFKQFSHVLGRLVVDKTGLTATYNIDFKWTPVASLAAQSLESPTHPASDSAPPALFTATKEQLGLKFESQKGPVEILVIDHAGKPSEN